MPVVLGAGWPGVLLHEAVGHGLEGTSTGQRAPPPSPARIGEQVASRHCTIVDDGTCWVDAAPSPSMTRGRRAATTS